MACRFKPLGVRDDLFFVMASPIYPADFLTDLTESFAHDPCRTGAGDLLHGAAIPAVNS